MLLLIWWCCCPDYARLEQLHSSVVWKSEQQMGWNSPETEYNPPIIIIILININIVIVVVIVD